MDGLTYWFFFFLINFEHCIVLHISRRTNFAELFANAVAKENAVTYFVAFFLFKGFLYSVGPWVKRLSANFQPMQHGQEFVQSIAIPSERRDREHIRHFMQNSSETKNIRTQRQAEYWYTWGRVFHWGKSRGPVHDRGRQGALGSSNMPGPRGSRWSYICHTAFHHQAVTRRPPFQLPLCPERWDHNTKNAVSQLFKGQKLKWFVLVCRRWWFWPRSSC